MHEDRLKGDLSRGKLADLAVLSDDLFTVPAERIRDVTVLATAVGGVLVHDAAGFAR